MTDPGHARSVSEQLRLAEENGNLPEQRQDDQEESNENDQEGDDGE